MSFSRPLHPPSRGSNLVPHNYDLKISCTNAENLLATTDLTSLLRTAPAWPKTDSATPLPTCGCDRKHCPSYNCHLPWLTRLPELHLVLLLHFPAQNLVSMSMNRQYTNLHVRPTILCLLHKLKDVELFISDKC